jgi:hypothetical protein
LKIEKSIPTEEKAAVITKKVGSNLRQNVENLLKMKKHPQTHKIIQPVETTV